MKLFVHKRTERPAILHIIINLLSWNWPNCQLDEISRHWVKIFGRWNLINNVSELHAQMCADGFSYFPCICPWNPTHTPIQHLNQGNQKIPKSKKKKKRGKKERRKEWRKKEGRKEGGRKEGRRKEGSRKEGRKKEGRKEGRKEEWNCLKHPYRLSWDTTFTRKPGFTLSKKILIYSIIYNHVN